MPTLRLQCLKETAAARLYQFKDGTKTWIPRSQCKSVVKFPCDPLDFPIHEITVSDWWWNQYELKQSRLDEDPLKEPDDLEEYNRNESNDYRDE